MQIKLNSLLAAINSELKKAEKSYKMTKKSAEEIAATSRTSWSQAGDRYHSQSSADLAKQKLESILALKKEIEEKSERIIFKYNRETIYIVDNPIMIAGFKIVSTKSLLGEKILNGK